MVELNLRGFTGWNDYPAGTQFDYSGNCPKCYTAGTMSISAIWESKSDQGHMSVAYRCGQCFVRDWKKFPKPEKIDKPKIEDGKEFRGGTGSKLKCHTCSGFFPHLVSVKVNDDDWRLCCEACRTILKESGVLPLA